MGRVMTDSSPTSAAERPEGRAERMLVPQEQADYTERRRSPEQERPLHQVRARPLALHVEIGDAALQPCLGFRQLVFDFGVELKQSLFELGVERGPLRAPLSVEPDQQLFELGV